MSIQACYVIPGILFAGDTLIRLVHLTDPIQPSIPIQKNRIDLAIFHPE
jgi:hypothetical protein